MDYKIGVSAQVRGLNVRDPGVGTWIEPEANPRGELIVAQGLPAFVESVRLGEIFRAIQGTSVVALAAVLPTTVAGSVLYNNNVSGGKSLIVLGATVTLDVSEAAAASFQLFVEPSLVALTAQPATADTAVIRSFLTGKTYGGGAQTSKTVTVTDNGWVPVGPTVTTALLTSIGYVAGGRLDIPYIIGPGYYLAAALSSVNAIGSGKIAFDFIEIQIPRA